MKQVIKHKPTIVMTIVVMLGIAAFGVTKSTASADEEVWVAQALDKVKAEVQIQEVEGAKQSLLEQSMKIVLDVDSPVRAVSSAEVVEMTQEETTVEEETLAVEEKMEVEQVEEVEPATSQVVEIAPTTPTTSGYELTVEASAYSYAEAGLSNYTADGTNLINDPNVIAVDPRVIPLGSLVEIPGYGVFRAADTGGAIKGNKIDIHFTTVEQCYAFGRRTLTIRVLS